MKTRQKEERALSCQLGPYPNWRAMWRAQSPPSHHGHCQPIVPSSPRTPASPSLHSAPSSPPFTCANGTSGHHTHVPTSAHICSCCHSIPRFPEISCFVCFHLFSLRLQGMVCCRIPLENFLAPRLAPLDCTKRNVACQTSAWTKLDPDKYTNRLWVHPLRTRRLLQTWWKNSLLQIYCRLAKTVKTKSWSFVKQLGRKEKTLSNQPNELPCLTDICRSTSKLQETKPEQFDFIL